jgi:uracil-DNA glycosylase
MDKQGMLIEHQQALKNCRRCSDLGGPVVVGAPVLSSILLIGQAPGASEGRAAKPFAWTAGRTLFQWFHRIGLDEAAVRQHVYLSAVCRCFPGRRAGGGDRVPGSREISNCAQWLKREIDLLRPQLILPVGKLAVSRMMAADRLADVIGRQYRVSIQGLAVDVIPLPHPSGASNWHKTEAGNRLLGTALSLIEAHPSWLAIRQGCGSQRR